MEKGNEGQDSKVDPVKALAKVDPVTAEEEVKRWLDLKRIPERKRKEMLDANLNNLVYSVEAGFLSFDFEKKRAIVKLQVPLLRKQGSNIDKLELRFNMGVNQAFNNSKGIAPDDSNERTLGMISALCDTPIKVLQNADNTDGEVGLDLADFNVMRDYAIFFLA